MGAVPDQVPIPDHMDLYHLHQEAEPSDRTALQSVVDHIEAEVARLNALEEHIMCECGPEDERLQARAPFLFWRRAVFLVFPGRGGGSRVLSEGH